jgi:hypothetical protein
MTDEQMQRQIEIIQQASAEARKSKESARQFLMDAGIIKENKKTKLSSKKK